MPEIRVQDEQGNIHVFPEGSTPEMIAKVMNVKPPSSVPSPDEYGASGFEHYEAPPISGLLIGAAKSIPGLTGGLTGFEQGETGFSPEELKAGMKIATEPQTLAEQTGHTIGTVAQLLPWGAGAPGVLARGAETVAGKLVPSVMKANAGRIFESVAQDAGNVPVVLKNSQEAAVRLMELQRTSNLGPVVNKFLNRITKPNAPPLTYNEARDFYSALGDLAWSDKMTIRPGVRYVMKNLATGLKQDIGDAAESVGRAGDYYSALGNYARAQHLKTAYLTLAGSVGAWAAKKYQAMTSLADVLAGGK